jgi:uncharacterized protein (DUF2141 family)
MWVKSLCLLTTLIGAESLADPALKTAQGGAAAAKGQSCEIDVTVDNLRKSGERYRGQVCYTLFRGKDGFPDKSSLAYANGCVPVNQSATLNLTIKDLPCDSEYALALLHDENMNRQMDKNLGLPTEGIGMSKNPSFLRVNAPPFDDVKFRVEPPRSSQVIHIHYF